MGNLKPCPLCGGEANARWFAEHDSIQCDKCGLVAILPQHGCGNEHITAWNTRPEPRVLSCEGCKHKGQYENEIEYGYPSPCAGCKRRAQDRYSPTK